MCACVRVCVCACVRVYVCVVCVSVTLFPNPPRLTSSADILIGKHDRHELSLKNVADNRHAGKIKGTLQKVCGREEDARNLAGADATRPTFLTVCCEN